MLRRAFLRRMAALSGLGLIASHLPWARAAEPRAIQWVRATFPLDGDRCLSMFLGSAELPIAGLELGDSVTYDVMQDGRPLTGVVDYVSTQPLRA